MAAACMSKSVLATSGILAIGEIADGKIAASVTGKMAMATCVFLSPAKG